MNMSFEQVVAANFPEIVNAGVITRRQAQEIQKDFGVKWPAHIINMSNSVGRGVFRFSADLQLDVVAPVIQETDAELDTRIHKTYESMELLVNSVADGITKSMIISGAPGIGKSYGIRKILEQNINCEFTFVKGYVKNTGIYRLLWENRFENNILIFDDSDKIFEELDSVNMLKHALELSKTRRISWLSEKEFVDEFGEQIPRSFDYEGTILFLTNIDFNDLISRGNKLAPHLAALRNRSLYLDMGIKTNRELMARIKQVVAESTLFADYNISAEVGAELMSFLTNNVDRLLDLSIRSVEKLATLYSASPDKWETLARLVMLKK